jgi:hypothetical protein
MNATYLYIALVPVLLWFSCSPRRRNTKDSTNNKRKTTPATLVGGADDPPFAGRIYGTAAEG